MHVPSTPAACLCACMRASCLQVRVELSDEQRELYKVILGKNYEALVGESRPALRDMNFLFVVTGGDMIGRCC
jgi:hypothetical protein